MGNFFGGGTFDFSDYSIENIKKVVSVQNEAHEDSPAAAAKPAQQDCLPCCAVWMDTEQLQKVYDTKRKLRMTAIPKLPKNLLTMIRQG